MEYKWKKASVTWSSRLSGMNLVNDLDMPLIIKSSPYLKKRIQVYFIEQWWIFQKENNIADEEGVMYPIMMIFLAKELWKLLRNWTGFLLSYYIPWLDGRDICLLLLWWLCFPRSFKIVALLFIVNRSRDIEKWSIRIWTDLYEANLKHLIMKNIIFRHWLIIMQQTLSGLNKNL
jgi:hypothetical protein